MNVNRKNIDKAFALSQRASEDATLSPNARNLFRAIARQIWLACGESRPTQAVIAAAENESDIEQARRMRPAAEFPEGAYCDLVDRRYMEGGAK